MRSFGLAVAAALGLALGVSAEAAPFSVPLPPPGNITVTAFDVYGEVFLEIKGDDNTLGEGGSPLPVGFYSDFGVGYSPDVDGNGTKGYVLYKGGLSHTSAAPDLPVPANPNAQILMTAPAGVSNAITQLFTGNAPGNGDVRGRLFAAGRVLHINNPDEGAGVDYWDADQFNGNPQLTFSIYNAYVGDMAMQAAEDTLLNTVDGHTTTYQLRGSDGQELHLDIYADITPDALVKLAYQGSAVAGQRYQSYGPAGDAQKPELPLLHTDGTLLCDPDTGTYYDPSGTWGYLAFATEDIATPDEFDDDAIMWSFVGSDDPDAANQFAFNQTYYIGPDAEKYTWPDYFGPGADLVFYPQSGIKLNATLPQLTPGPTLNTSKGTLDPDDGLYYGFLNNLFQDGYTISGDFWTGAEETGAEASDPNTFTFQQTQFGGVSATKLSGELLIPEPVTIVSLILAAGGIGAYVHRRRWA